jgi:surface polysaccharide O-acyltransferase-like enzyme
VTVGRNDGAPATVNAMQSPVETGPIVQPRAGTAEQRNIGLDMLRIAAICGVVSIHIFGVISGSEDSRESLKWWLAVVLNVGMAWVVPTFVMISGALTLAPRAHGAGVKAFYLARVRRIIPAMVFWHLFYLVAVRAMMNGEELTVAGATMAVIDADAYTGLYFLWVICGLYIVAPVFQAFVSHGSEKRAVLTGVVALIWGWSSVVVAGLASVIGEPRPLHFGALNSWLYYLGFFLMGWALRNIRLRGGPLLLVAFLATALLLEMIWQFGSIAERPVLNSLLPVSRLGVVAGLAALAIFVVGNSVGRMIRASPGWRRWLKSLSDASFGVFLVHLFVFRVLQEAFPIVRGGSSFKAIAVSYIVVIVASFAISLVAQRIPVVRTVF